MANISVLGAGSWGLGLALLLNNNGQKENIKDAFLVSEFQTALLSLVIQQMLLTMLMFLCWP